jgi:hypothetical protein
MRWTFSPVISKCAQDTENSPVQKVPRLEQKGERGQVLGQVRIFIQTLVRLGMGGVISAAPET